MISRGNIQTFLDESVTKLAEPLTSNTP